MKNFTYYRPTTAEQAVGLLAAEWGTTELLAGGTDLLDLQKEYIAQPDKVVSLSGDQGVGRHQCVAPTTRRPPRRYDRRRRQAGRHRAVDACAQELFPR